MRCIQDTDMTAKSAKEKSSSVILELLVPDINA